MITLNELRNVSSWAVNVPYPGTNYAEKTINKLINAVSNYEKYYMDKIYDIILSSGDQFTLEIMAKNLCHMLGIDYKNLSGEYFQKFREEVLGIDLMPKSFDFLKILLENIDKVLKYDHDNAGKVLNYYRIMVKCSIFEKLSDFTKFNFGVINFDKNLYLNNSGNNYSGNTEKFLYVQSNEQNCPYFLMGILPNSRNGIEENYSDYELSKKYVVDTLIAPSNPRDFFEGQKVSIPTQILLTDVDSMDKIEASPGEKIALLNQYRAIVKEFGILSNIDIYADYLATLSSQENDFTSSLIRIK